MSLKRFQCPSCGAGLDYEESRALTMRCPYCNSSVIVPESLRAAEPDAMSGMDSVLDDAQTARLADVAHLLHDGRKIEAIKRFRETFDVGLKEAKDAVEQMEAGQAVDISGFNTVTIVTQPGTTLDGDVSAEIQRLAQSGNKIAAIKLMRERTGLGLAEAKNAVEAMELAWKVAGAFGATPMSATPVQRAEPASLVTVVDGTPNFAPTVVGGSRRGGCGCAPLFGLLLLLLGAAIFIPMPWADWNENLDLPTDLLPANDQSLWQKYTTDFPTDLGVAIPGTGSGPLLAFGESGTGQGAFSDPRHLALDGRGNLFVADFDTGRIQRFDEDGNFRSLFRVDAAPIQGMAATREGRLYIVQSGKVTAYDSESGEVIDTVGLGSLFSVASNVGVAPDGSLLVTTMVPEERVTRFNRSGSNSNRLNIESPFMGLVGTPEPKMFVAEDGIGNIYVLGSFNNTVLKFAPDGRFLNQFGSGDIRDLTANAIAIDSRGRVYVAHFDGVLVFDSESGRRLAQVDTDGVPYSVAIGDDDAVWVVTASGQVAQYHAVES